MNSVYSSLNKEVIYKKFYVLTVVSFMLLSSVLRHGIQTFRRNTVHRKNVSKHLKRFLISELCISGTHRVKDGLT